MMSFSRLLCLLRGHVPGGPVIFSYARKGRFLEQRPDLRGPTIIRILGTKCPRCGAIQEPADQPEAFAAAREMVKSLTGTEV